MDVITTHLNADFDGLASMVAGRKLYAGAVLVLPGGAQEAARSFMAVHDLGLTRFSDLDLSRVTRLIMMDTHDPDRLGPLKPLYDNPKVAIHIYDHHPPEAPAETQVLSRAERTIIEPVGATTTILIERLKAQHIQIAPFEATVLALGLYEETGSFAFASTTPRDLEAAAHVLRAGADLNLVTDTLHRPLNPELIALLSDLLRSSESLYLEGRKVLVATSTYDQYRGDLAEAVHKLAELEGYDAVIAAIVMDDKVEIIGRSRRDGIKIGDLLREFGGGGHDTAGAATVKGRTLIEVREQLVELLTQRFRPVLLAREVMTAPVKVVGDAATVIEVEALMTRYEVNALPVVDGQQRYRGFVTREIIQKALFHQFGKTPVINVMQTDAYTASPHTPFTDIQTHMLERNQRFVPILEDGKVVGVITRTDLLRTLRDEMLKAAELKKGQEPAEFFKPRRNVRTALQSHLPAHIFALLERAGALADRLHVSAYVVGGFVRDLLLRRPNLDLDLVIEGDGIAYARALAQELGASITTHERFGTAVLSFPDGFKLDVATARTEYYEYPTALPTVERSSIKKDLYRRDFTINTLAIRLNANRFGELIDFYGGQRDLNEKTIRVLHSLSFVEDPTRVFRAIRFEQRFGFRLARDTVALIKGAVRMDLFHRLSGPRLLEELVHLLSEEEPRKAITRLQELDLLRFIHPGLTRDTRLDRMLKSVEDALDWYKLLYLDRKMDGWLVYFMALMDRLPGEAVHETLTRLMMPERDAEKVRIARFRSEELLRRLRHPTLKPSEVFRTLNGLPDEVLLLLLAKAKSESVKRRLSAYLTTYQQTKPLLTGKDLQEMGISPGPLYRSILDRLLAAHLDGEVMTKEDERTLAMQTAREQGRSKDEKTR